MRGGSVYQSFGFYDVFYFYRTSSIHIEVRST